MTSMVTVSGLNMSEPGILPGTGHNFSLSIVNVHTISDELPSGWGVTGISKRCLPDSAAGHATDKGCL